jgi:hypothetical protein
MKCLLIKILHSQKMGGCCTKDEFKPNTGGMPEKRSSLKIRGRIDEDEQP